MNPKIEVTPDGYTIAAESDNNPNDTLTITVSGDLGLILTDADGNIEGEWHYHNIVMTSVQVLLAQFFTGLTTVYGASYMDFGSGSSAWDTPPIPAPTNTDTALVAPITPTSGRKATTGNTYLDISGNPTGTPTNRPRMICQLTPTDGALTLREASLFSSNSSTVGAGQMLTELRFAAINKSAGSTLTANYDLTILISTNTVGQLCEMAVSS